MKFLALIATTVRVTPRASTIICHNSEELGRRITAADGHFWKMGFPEGTPGIHVFEGQFTSPITGTFRDPTQEEMFSISSGVCPWPEKSTLDTVKETLRLVTLPITEGGEMALDIASNLYSRENGDEELSFVASRLLFSLPPAMAEERRALTWMWARSASHRNWNFVPIIARDTNLATAVLWVIEDRLAVNPMDNGPEKDQFLGDMVTLTQEYEAKEANSLNRAILKILAKIRKHLEDE